MTLEHAIILLILMLVAQGPILVAALVSYIKSRAAIDENTRVTRVGTAAAANNAKVAAANALEAKSAVTTTMSVVENIEKKLNGGVDSAIAVALAPVRKAIEEHAAADNKNMDEVRVKFGEIAEYIHRRNHDVIDAINAQSLKFDVLMAKINDPRGNT